MQITNQQIKKLLYHFKIWDEIFISYRDGYVFFDAHQITRILRPLLRRKYIISSVIGSRWKWILKASND